MLRHVVLFQFSCPADDPRVAAAAAALLALPAEIAEIRGIAFGPNRAPDAGAWTHVLQVDVDDLDALGRYAAHPAHVRVVREHLAPIRAGRLVADYDVAA